jgi:hypothetical protein
MAYEPIAKKNRQRLVGSIALASDGSLRQKCRIISRGTGYRAIIPSYSVPVLHNLLASVMSSMMRHKIGL